MLGLVSILKTSGIYTYDMSHLQEPTGTLTIILDDVGSEEPTESNHTEPLPDSLPDFPLPAGSLLGEPATTPTRFFPEQSLRLPTASYTISIPPRRFA